MSVQSVPVSNRPAAFERVNPRFVVGSNDALLARTVFTTSANGRTQTSVSDLDGDTDTDRTDTSVITVNADGSTNSVVTVNNGDGSLRSRVTVAQSANSLSKTTTVDVNGDSVWDKAMNDNQQRSICIAA